MFQFGRSMYNRVMAVAALVGLTAGIPRAPIGSLRDWGPSPAQLPSASAGRGSYRSGAARIVPRRGLTNKTPSESERARRRRQIAAGTFTASNGLLWVTGDPRVGVPFVNCTANSHGEVVQFP